MVAMIHARVHFSQPPRVDLTCENHLLLHGHHLQVPAQTEWPDIVTPQTKNWINDFLSSGTVDGVAIHYRHVNIYFQPQTAGAEIRKTISRSIRKSDKHVFLVWQN